MYVCALMSEDIVRCYPVWSHKINHCKCDYRREFRDITIKFSNCLLSTINRNL